MGRGAEGKYIKFSWNDETKPPVVDTEGTPITDEDTPIYGGPKVKLALFQKPYILKDGSHLRHKPEAQGCAGCLPCNSAGVDTGDMDDADVAELFGQHKASRSLTPRSLTMPVSLKTTSDGIPIRSRREGR